MNRDNGVERVLLAGEKLCRLQRLHVLPQRDEAGAEVGGHVFALFRELEVGLQIRQLARQLFVGAKQPFQALSFGEGFFCCLAVLPEIRLGYFFLEGFESAALLGEVKVNS